MAMLKEQILIPLAKLFPYCIGHSSALLIHDGLTRLTTIHRFSLKRHNIYVVYTANKTN